jgi:uncharacterized protein
MIMEATSENERPIGFVVEKSTATEFTFVLFDKEISVGSYLMTKTEIVQKTERFTVDILSQVAEIGISSDYLMKSLAPDVIQNIVKQNIANPYFWGKAKILGYYDPQEKTIIMPRVPLSPGEPMWQPSDEYMRMIFALPEETAIHAGHLINRRDVPVDLDLRGLSKHLAILAQTGAGKSYCVGVILEELARLGATIIIIDPHADYVFLGQTKDRSILPWQNRVKVFKNPESSVNYKALEIDEKQLVPFFLTFDVLESDDLCEIANVPPNAANLRDYVDDVIDGLSGQDGTAGDGTRSSKKYTFDDFVKQIKDDKASDVRETRVNAKRSAKYFKKVEQLNVFGDQTIDINEVLKNGQISVIDLSGLHRKAMEIITAQVLNYTYKKLETKEFPYPVYVVIEEAHNFAPPVINSQSKRIINRIAGEGRKFGMFQILVSQRPSKIDPDSLSQCNSQIILRITNVKDQTMVAESAEQMSASLMEDLPSLNRGEAVIVGPITKLPVIVKIRERKTKEGGSDLDVVSLLADARKEQDMDQDDRERNQAARKKHTGSFDD